MRRSLPFISCIIPTLNAGHLLDRCLRSVAMQNYPKNKIEIIVVDGGSTDATRAIAKKYHTKILDNPAVFQEIGKSKAGYIAKGELRFYIDADNVLVGKNWFRSAVRPYLENDDVIGILPQTTAPPDSCGINQYLEFLTADPFTWFIYGDATNPQTFEHVYKPVKKTPYYILYRFPTNRYPVFGLAQGLGVHRSFQRKKYDQADDMRAGIEILKRQKLIAYIPKAYVYHYHVSGVKQYVRKFRWKIRNNLSQTIPNSGIIHRLSYFSFERKLRMVLFVPYALLLLFPLLDAIKLSIRHKSLTMFWHIPATYIMAILILSGYIRKAIGSSLSVGHYE